MAFDGITISCIVKELSDALTGGRIYKIAQPESDALVLTVRREKDQAKLLLSANASLPLIYMTDRSYVNPMTAPGFCMLLRKHLSNGRIISITQPGLERIVRIRIQHLDEMGDLKEKSLLIEIMGKHSNIIFIDENEKIIDSIKHISGLVSSVREVLPGRDYFIPQTQDKIDPLLTDNAASLLIANAKPADPVYKALYTTYTGISPCIAQELCHRANVDSSLPLGTLSEADLHAIEKNFAALIDNVKAGTFSPNIVFENRAPREYAAVTLTMYEDDVRKDYDSVSALLEAYYAEKDAVTRIRQKSTDLRKIVSTHLERNIKKYDLQIRQLADTEKRDTYKIYGELLHTYGYSAKPGDRSLTCDNYYTGEKVTIPLDNTLTPAENAQRYFDKYGKMKRTNEALTELTKEVKSEIDHLESVMTSLDIAEKEDDLTQIKEELIQTGYIRRKGGSKKAKLTGKPLHFRDADGYDFYVGKNNFQNDELTFGFATGGDWWFHAKHAPGSHVILKNPYVGRDGTKELPDHVFEEAAALAAYYSKIKDQPKVEVDYTIKKNVKKPGGGAPGFVVYYTNYSMAIAPTIDGLTQVE
ncbi:MAG: NFACT family protein [Lachnospiraceae bacterium]|nr:NFACT family protein [Lachnospiraceae bacterium]